MIACTSRGYDIPHAGTLPESPGGFHGSPNLHGHITHHFPQLGALKRRWNRQQAAQAATMLQGTQGAEQLGVVGRLQERIWSEGHQQEKHKEWWICLIWVNLSWILFGLYFLMDLDENGWWILVGMDIFRLLVLFFGHKQLKVAFMLEQKSYHHPVTSERFLPRECINIRQWLMLKQLEAHWPLNLTSVQPVTSQLQSQKTHRI